MNLDAKQTRLVIVFGVLLGLLGISMVMGMSFGSTHIPLHEVARTFVSGLPGMGSLLSDRAEANSWDTIIWDLRAPAMVMALLVGLGLAVSGSSMQSLFRNPLADPFIIGISAGGGFGAVVGLLLTNWLDLTATTYSFLGGQVTIAPGDYLMVSLAFLFSMGAVMAAYWIARTGGRTPVTLLLLAGVAISALLTALTQFLVYLRLENPTQFVVSLMGSVSNSQWYEVGIVLVGTIIATAVLLVFARRLNVMSLGETEARSLGIDVERSKLIILGAAALAAAIGIPFVGIIGFVGLFIPHIMRRFVGPNLRLLVPASALAGASFLIIADIISRGIFQVLSEVTDLGLFEDTQVPIGVTTSLIGGGFFIYLLILGRRRGNG